MGRTRAIGSECKIDKVDFTDWMTFLSSNYKEEIGANLETITVNT